MVRTSIGAAFLVMLLPAGLAAGARTAEPDAVSPGLAGRFGRVTESCPTFSWGAEEGASSFELVVYTLPQELEDVVAVGPAGELARLEPALQKALPGTSRSWTPDRRDSLAGGQRYVWFIRALAGEEAGPWSRGLLFEVPQAPSPEEVREALAVLERYLAAGGETAVPALRSEMAQVRSRQEPAAGGQTPGTRITVPAGPVGLWSETAVGNSTAVFGHSTTGVGGRGVWGSATASSGITYGLYGTAVSQQGYGLWAENTGGGLAGYFSGPAKAVVEGSLIGLPGAIPARRAIEGVIDGPGLFGVGVYGQGAGGEVGLLGGPYAGVYGEAGDVDDRAVHGKHTDAGGFAGYFEGRTKVLGPLEITGQMTCPSCVDTDDLLDETVGSADLADDAVTGVKVKDGEIASADIQDDSILPADIDMGVWRRSLVLVTRQAAVGEGVSVQTNTADCGFGGLFLSGWCTLSSGAAADGVSIIGSYGQSAGTWTCDTTNSNPPVDTSNPKVQINLNCLEQ